MTINRLMARWPAAAGWRGEHCWKAATHLNYTGRLEKLA